MKKKRSPLLGIGLVILIAYMTVERLIVSIPGIIAIPLLMVSIGFIFAGGLKNKENKE